jgi:hypothetical protein
MVLGLRLVLVDGGEETLSLSLLWLVALVFEWDEPGLETTWVLALRACWTVSMYRWISGSSSQALERV